MSLLPYPDRIQEICSLFESLSINHRELLWEAKRYSVESEVNGILEDIGVGKRKLSESELDPNSKHLFDAYSFHRACIQVNESCNKLWATMELAHAVSPEIRDQGHELMGESFSEEFLLGTLIPALYYSQLSAIISCLSSFGCVSLRDDKLPRARSYNLVRTRKAWILFERRKYIKDAFSVSSRGWHNQILGLLWCFTKYLSDFPRISHYETVKLGKLRNRTHYEILSEVSALKVSGIDQYFEFLPLTVNTINSALSLIYQLHKLPGYSGANRFCELHRNFRKLFRSYGKRYPRSKVNPISF